MAEESLFLSFVRFTFKKWVGFQDALQEGMGGPYAREKEEWLGTEVEKYFQSYDDVSPYDLEEYLGTMIDNEFDICFEDGSLLQTCKLFCQAYNLSRENPNAPLFQPLKQHMQTENRERRPKLSNPSEVVAKETTVTSEMEKLALQDSEEESWTVVNRKGQRK